MSYFPKSKVNIKEASIGEFIYKENRKSFKGKYLELSNGKYYEGIDTTNLGNELIKLVEELSNNQIGSSFDVRKYNALDPKKKNFLKNTKTPPINKNIPTEQDYQRGYYNRYFTRRINQPKGYIEINFDTLKKLQEKTDYDYHLYEIGSITWALKNGTRKINNNNLRLLEQKFSYISTLFPILNEFEIIDSPLNTTGGELYYEDGREYIGPYHIHPDKGPMVGAQHISEPHDLLKYSNELSVPADSVETTIPRILPTPDVDYKNFKSPQQKQTKVTPKQATPRLQISKATTPIRRSSMRRGGY